MINFKYKLWFVYYFQVKLKNKDLGLEAWSE